MEDVQDANTCATVENKKTSLALHSSSRAVNHSASGRRQVSQSSRRKWSFTGCQTRKGSVSVGDRHVSAAQAPGRAMRVLDDDGNDVTPLPLCPTELGGDTQSEPGRLFLPGETSPSSGSDRSKATPSFNVPSSSSFVGSSRPSSLSTKASLTKESEDSVPKLDRPINPPALCEVPRKRDNVKQHVTEEMLGEAVYVCLSETDTVSLLDIPCTIVSEDADDAEAIKEGNSHYAELCKSGMGNGEYADRWTRTFNGAPKSKQIQSDKIVMVDKGTIATPWDIYDSFCDQNDTPVNKKADCPETSKGQETGREKGISSSTVGTGSTSSSLLETEMCGNSSNAEPDPQLTVWSESFQHSLLAMERSIVANVLQPKLAAYRQLPILEDPDSAMKPGLEEQSGEGEEESSPSPALEHLWALSCELTRGCGIASMTWNKENPDLLAVGYGDCDSGSGQKPGLICCWSLKNPMWPERVFNCHSCVTALDFSASNPGHLAAGMYDGTVAIYSVQSQNRKACVASSSECSKKHVHPVWQVNWTKQELKLSGEDGVEALVSVSADGRITKWFLCSNSLDCADLMRIQNSKKKATGNKKKAESVLSAVTPGLCVGFHPTDYKIYLAGTWEGLIRKCSFSNSQHFLDTYQKHFCPVNYIEWSPFSSGVFLSCSSDWTIQLWKQDRFAPVLSFTSTQKAVHAVRWSPNWSTVFAAINGQQVEIWDLNSSVLHPILVHHAAPGVRMTSLLFARGTDCVLVGDSDGQVTVYQLKNLSVGEREQVDSLEDIIRSAVSRQLSLE